MNGQGWRRDLFGDPLAALDRATGWTHLIYGPKSSVFGIQEEIERQGKRYVQTLDWYRDAQPYLDTFDCVIQTGTWNKPAVSVPIYQVFWAGYGELGNDLQPEWSWFYEDLMP